MIAAILFDVDGTLAETEEFHRRAFNRAFCEMGLDWYWDEPLYLALLKVTGGKERILDFMTRFDPALLAKAETLIPALHARKTRIYMDFVTAGAIPLRPGIQDFILEAKDCGMALAIATTTSLQNVTILLETTLGCGWDTLFPVIAAGDMVARKKPAPDIYALALERLGHEPDCCVAIEDSRNGVLSAQAAGLRVIAVRSVYTRDDDLSGAATVVQNPLDLTMHRIRELATPQGQSIRSTRLSPDRQI